MEPRMGDGENWTNGKVRKTELTEFFVSGFLSAEYQHWPLWKNWKMVAISLISIVWKNVQLLTPQKFGSPVFQVSMETEYQCWPLWKNWKKAAISLISIVRKKNCVDRNGISADTGDANFLLSEFSIGSFSPITHPRLHFNIYAWLHLKHLCVATLETFMRGHLCVVYESPMCSFTLPDIHSR